MKENRAICPINDTECPYWDWKTHMCAMPEEGAHPKDECEAYDYYDEPDED